MNILNETPAESKALLQQKLYIIEKQCLIPTPFHKHPLYM